MAGVQEGRLGAVIDRFYEAAVVPDLWRSVLHDAGECVGGVGAVLLPGPNAPVVAVASRALEEGVEAGLRDGWYNDNPRVVRGVAVLRGPTDIVTERRIFSPEEQERLPFNADYVRRYGLGDFAGLLLAPAGASSIFLSFERKQTQGPYTTAELTLISRLVPHLQRAGQLTLRLAEARAGGMLDAFSMMNCGGVLLDARGAAIRLNLQAERHVGRGLRLQRGQLLAQDHRLTPALQRLIASVVGRGALHEHVAGPAVVIPRPERLPLVIHAAPIAGAARDLFQSAKAILMIVDPEHHPEPAIPLLRQAFGLSPAEARLAADIGAGGEIGAIAARRGVSEGTVRAQLKSVFAKTSTRRQGQLVALIQRMTKPGPCG